MLAGFPLQMSGISASAGPQLVEHATYAGIAGLSVAAQGQVYDGLIFLGYPLHPAKQIEKRRVEHWAKLSPPALFVQGTRDALYDLDVLKSELPRIPSPLTLHVVEGGDHSFKVPNSFGKSQEDAWKEVELAITTRITKATYGKS